MAAGVATDLEEIAALVLDDPIPPGVLQLCEQIARRYVTPRARVFTRAIPARVRVRVQEEARSLPEVHPRCLTAYEGGRALLDALTMSRPGAWSLRAVPGEQRGRLVMELVAAATRSSGSALVLVPEVRYGSLVIAELQRTVPTLARLDSAIADSRRASSWIALARGAKLGVGGRAAVLAPVRDLRLIVVDEEHHPAFKEDRSPRFDAVRAAVTRAALEGAVCVLIDRAPTVETGAAAAAGRYGRVHPTRAAARAARPLVEVVQRTPDRALSRELHQRIQATVRSGGRVGLLVPSRGYARAIWCATCRRSVRCPNCEAGMFLDRTPRRVRCPRCGWTDRPPDRCSHCSSTDLRFIGAGSERLAEQVQAAFPRARVGRADPETLSTLPSTPDIYITTWVGTKETLRPNVELVGVLDADVLIRRADFRAAENAYQALVEMAEWAGPASRGGRLLIQSAEPAHYSIQAVVRADYDFFLERELQQRRELHYPPYSQLIKIRVSGERRSQIAETVATAARAQSARVLGPIAVPPRNQDSEAMDLLLKCEVVEPVADALRSILEDVPAGNRMRIDVDPR